MDTKWLQEIDTHLGLIEVPLEDVVDYAEKHKLRHSDAGRYLVAKAQREFVAYFSAEVPKLVTRIQELESLLDASATKS